MPLDITGLKQTHEKLVSHIEKGQTTSKVADREEDGNIN